MPLLPHPYPPQTIAAKRRQTTGRGEVSKANETPVYVRMGNKPRRGGGQNRRKPRPQTTPANHARKPRPQTTSANHVRKPRPQTTPATHNIIYTNATRFICRPFGACTIGRAPHRGYAPFGRFTPACGLTCLRHFSDTKQIQSNKYCPTITLKQIPPNTI